MSRIPTVNPYRVYENKTIDIVSLLPNNMRGGEIETFTELFQKYLNEMYVGTVKYIPPEQLEIIPYDSEIIWSNKNQYITTPYGNFLSTFEAGDYVKKNGDDVYYKIEVVVDDSTIKLCEPFINVTPSYLKTAYWDNFSTQTFSPFWQGNTITSPVGMDGMFDNFYKIDSVNSRAYCYNLLNDNSDVVSVVGTEINGELELEFGFQRSTKSSERNGEFGFSFESGPITYKICYDNGFMNFYVSGGASPSISGNLELADTEDGWVVNVTRKRDTGKIKIKVSSLRPKSGSTPLLFVKTVGFFNRHEYEFDMPTEDVFGNNITLKIISAIGQGWDYMYFQSDYGFPGEVDNISLVNSLNEMPDVYKIYGTPMGRTFETDGEYPSGRFPIYQFYQYNGSLRIRNLEESIAVGKSEFREGVNHISILEKIRRLTELHDPELIDMEYIQHFARYMGYTVDINRDTLSSFYKSGDLSNEEQQDIMEKYLRSIMGNLPHWYKIKSTGNAVAIMLYSFGLITDLRNFYCTNYDETATGSSWISFSENDEVKLGLTDKHFITPHFGVRFNIESAVADEAKMAASMTAIIDSINSVRPINTVFKGLEAYFKRNVNSFYVNMCSYSNQYVYLK